MTGKSRFLVSQAMFVVQVALIATSVALVLQRDAADPRLRLAAQALLLVESVALMVRAWRRGYLGRRPEVMPDAILSDGALMTPLERVAVVAGFVAVAVAGFSG